MRVDVTINNINYTAFNSFELKMGVDIAVHSAIITFDILYLNLFSVDSRVSIKIHNTQLLSGKIKSIKTDNDTIKLTAVSATEILLNNHAESIVLNKVSLFESLRMINELKVSNTSFSFSADIVDTQALNKNAQYLDFLNELALKTGNRYYSFDDSIILYKKAGFTTVSIINDFDVLDLSVKKNNKYKYSKYSITSKKGLEEINYSIEIRNINSSKIYNLTVSNFTRNECSNLTNVMLDVHSEQSEYTVLTIQIDNKTVFLPAQLIQYSKQLYSILTVNYLYNYKSSQCILCLKRF